MKKKKKKNKLQITHKTAPCHHPSPNKRGIRAANINYRNCGRRVNPPLRVPPEVRRLKLISRPRAASKEIAAEVGQEWRGMIKVSQCHPPPNLREGYRQTNQLARETVDRLIAERVGKMARNSSRRGKDAWRRFERHGMFFCLNSGDRGISILVERDGDKEKGVRRRVVTFVDFPCVWHGSSLGRVVK